MMANKWLPTSSDFSRKGPLYCTYIDGINYAFMTVNLLSRSDFIWDFRKLPFPSHLGKYFIKIGKIRAKIHEIGKIKAIFGLEKTPI